MKEDTGKVEIDDVNVFVHEIASFFCFSYILHINFILSFESVIWTLLVLSTVYYLGPGPIPGLESSNRLDNVVRNGNSPTSERLSSPSRRKPDSAERIIASSDDDTDIDMLDDIESTKEVYRTKTELYVSDLSRKKVNTLEKKYNMYAWNLITVSVFYALPVVQLVITYQVVTNVTGNQDSCYYNFLCAKPYGWFSAFNNVFSNTGYVMLGILFLLLVWRKEYAHKKRVHAGYKNELTHGIPKHYGLLYALGYALIMEGIMSGSYHVCPNRANYQFDTAYMYMIACLGMLKMYQQRHPDINANSYKSFALFAVILFIGFLGLVSCPEEW
nr:SID1 transmembrane family member 1-like [Lytechinus pictus]